MSKSTRHLLTCTIGGILICEVHVQTTHSTLATHMSSEIVRVDIFCFIFFWSPANTTSIFSYLPYSCFKIHTLTTAELHSPYSVTLNDAAKLVKLGGAAPDSNHDGRHRVVVAQSNDCHKRRRVNAADAVGLHGA